MARQRYTLPGVDPRALDSDALEQTTMQLMGTANGNDFVGYNLGASLGRRANGINYLDFMRALNAQQDAISRMSMENERQIAGMELAGRVAPTLAEQPDVALFLDPILAITNPAARDYIRQAGAQTRGATIRNTNAQAVNRLSEAGVRPPMGTSYDLAQFMPSAAPVQGVPTAVMAAGAGNTSNTVQPRVTATTTGQGTETQYQIIAPDVRTAQTLVDQLRNPNAAPQPGRPVVEGQSPPRTDNVRPQAQARRLSVSEEAAIAGLRSRGFTQERVIMTTDGRVVAIGREGGQRAGYDITNGTNRAIPREQLPQ